MADADFNAKKSRAQKLRRDKHHSKPHKPPTTDKDAKTPKNVKPENHSSGPQKTSCLTSTASSLTETDPALFTHLKRETDEIERPAPKVFSKRAVTSNWGRYEIDVDPLYLIEENEAEIASFDYLAQQVSVGGHLKLSHEHEWDKEKTELQAPWFQLNVQQLNQNAASIPFYKRHNLSPQLFTEEQLKRMHSRALQAANQTESVKSNILKILGGKEKENIKQEIVAQKPINQYEHMPSTDESTANSPHPPAKPVTLPRNTATKTVVSPEELELDSWIEDLDLDKPIAVPPDVAALTLKFGDTLAAVVDKDDFDPVPSTASERAGQVATKTKPDELENWLDSILDD